MLDSKHFISALPFISDHDTENYFNNIKSTPIDKIELQNNYFYLKKRQILAKSKKFNMVAVDAQYQKILES